MKLARAGTAAKGWITGPWDGDLGVCVRYATTAIDEPHVHPRLIEIYLVGRGSASIRIERESFALGPGDVVLVAPGEAHTFLQSSPDYFHFVVQTRAVAGADAEAEKQLVPRGRLGL